MDAVSRALSRRASLYRHSVANGIEHPETSYRYMLAADVYDTLSPTFGTAMAHCPTLTDATQLTAGELYRAVYAALTGRTPKPHDCAALDKLEQSLLNQ